MLRVRVPTLSVILVLLAAETTLRLTRYTGNTGFWYVFDEASLTSIRSG